MKTYKDLTRQEVEKFADKEALNIETEQNYKEAAQELFKRKNTKKEMDTIEFNGIAYDCKEVTYEGVTYTIADKDLQDKLVNRDYSYVNEEAKHIDEGIVYFCDENEMKLSNKELCKIIFS